MKQNINYILDTYGIGNYYNEIMYVQYRPKLLRK